MRMTQRAQRNFELLKVVLQELKSFNRNSWTYLKLTVSLAFVSVSFDLRLNLDHQMIGFIDDWQVNETCPSRLKARHRITDETGTFGHAVRSNAVRSNEYSKLLSPCSNAVELLADVPRRTNPLSVALRVRRCVVVPSTEI